MNFRMPKEISGLFKKKNDASQGEPEYRNEDFGLEEDWEVDDPFVKDKNDKIVMEDVNPQKNSRRLKGKLIFGIAGALALFLAWSVLSNMMAPKQPAQKEESANLSTGSKMTNPAATVPNNYADMAKYQRELEQRKAAEEALKKRSMANQAVPNTNNVQAPPAPATPPSPPPRSYVQQQVPAVVQQDPGHNSAISFKLEGSGGVAEAAGSTGAYTPSVQSKVDMNSVFTLQAGTVIPATLLNGIDSRLSGDVIAQIRQDVYDSLTGQHLIFPQGAKLIGKVGKGSGRRVGVTFTRVILPDGSNVALPEQSAADGAGYPGMKDKYDTHDADFYRKGFVGLVTAVLADGVDHAMGNKNKYSYNSSSNSNEYIRSNVSDYMDNLADRITERASKTEEPNVRIRPGYQFNVFINQDFHVYEYMR
ncbi:MAG: TrbI/VirB10 family protein [Acidaminococcaceae bacterium]|nr:TrbI/VirB10 family protein [Acidaminococcaceae bacterium]